MWFGIDDSHVEIAGVHHSILAAIGAKDYSLLESSVAALKQEFGLSSSDEIKWNGMTLSQRSREVLSQELLSVLHETIPLVVIVEGRDKQAAAEVLAIQIRDYLTQECVPVGNGMQLLFDESILTAKERYGGFLSTLAPSPISNARLEVTHSHTSALIQLADVLAGFNRLATEIALGRRNKVISVWDEARSENMETDLLSYISLALRWATWGKVPSPPDPANIVFDGRWPFKHIGGFGLRINSSVATDVISAIYDSRIVYMGCMH